MRLTPFLLLICALLASAACYRGHSPRVDTPAMVTAAQWGSQPDPIPEDQRHRPSQITIHHAGVLWADGDDPYQKLTGLQAWGKRERQWPDVPYHYLIAPDGRIFEGRPIQFAPQTNTSYETRGHIGVQLWGNFEEQRVTEEQLRATAHLVAWLCDRHLIPPSTIMGHKDVAEGTLCPGEDLYHYVDSGDLRVWVAEIIAGREPDIKLKEPDGVDADDVSRGAGQPHHTPVAMAR